jgi:chromosome partitioning protein
MAKAKAVDSRFPKPKPLSSHGPARIIAMCNQKGGVGKTTTSINLGAALVEYGRKVLLVDFDPQGALSAGLGIVAHDGLTIFDLIQKDELNPHDAIRKTTIENLDVIAANIDLSAAEMNLVNEYDREKILKRILKKVQDEYDVILIDCQPSLGLLTVNALTAAHGVLIPLACEFFALRGVAILEGIIKKVQARLNETLVLDGVLATMFDSRTHHSREVMEMLNDKFGKTVFKTVISRTVKFPDATRLAEPITSYAPTSEAAEAYRAVARELISRGGAP